MTGISAARPQGTGRFRGGNGPPLVLLHGLGGAWQAWQPLLPMLCARFEVLALTLPGHAGGEPLMEQGLVTVAALADHIEQQLDQERLRNPHIVGVSLGGWLALQLAARGRAASVVAVAPIGLLTKGEMARLAFRLRFSRRVVAMARRLAYTLAGSSAGRRLLFRDTVHRPAQVSVEQARSWIDGFADCPSFDAIVDGLARDEPGRRLPEIACPAAVIWPEADRMTPIRPHAGRFQAALPSAAHAILRGAGHLPMTDAPGPLAEQIIALTRSGGRPVWQAA